MNIAISLSGAVALLAMSALPQPGLGHPNAGEGNVSQVKDAPIEWLRAIDVAFADFRNSEHPRKDCFTVTVEHQGEKLRVLFNPRRLPEDRNTRGGETACGRAVVYEVTLGGKILDKSFWR